MSPFDTVPCPPMELPEVEELRLEPLPDLRNFADDTWDDLPAMPEVKEPAEISELPEIQGIDIECEF